MRILVLYYSKTGNTEQLARAVAEGVEQIPGAEAVLRDTSQVSKDDFLSAQGVIAGSPVYFGVLAAELKQRFEDFIGTRKKMEGKVGAAFTTSGDPTGGKETTIFSIIQNLMIYGMIIVGDPMSATGHYGVACSGKPDEQTLENGRKLGARVADVASRLGLE